jgi:hypothetical protein
LGSTVIRGGGLAIRGARAGGGAAVTMVQRAVSALRASQPVQGPMNIPDAEREQRRLGEIYQIEPGPRFNLQAEADRLRRAAERARGSPSSSSGGTTIAGISPQPPSPAAPSTPASGASTSSGIASRYVPGRRVSAGAGGRGVIPSGAPEIPVASDDDDAPEIQEALAIADDMAVSAWLDGVIDQIQNVDDDIQDQEARANNASVAGDAQQLEDALSAIDELEQEREDLVNQVVANEGAAQQERNDALDRVAPSSTPRRTRGLVRQMAADLEARIQAAKDETQRQRRATLRPRPGAPGNSNDPPPRRPPRTPGTPRTPRTGRGRGR